MQVTNLLNGDFLCAWLKLWILILVWSMM